MGTRSAACSRLLWAARRRDRVAALGMVSSPFPAPRPAWIPAAWRGARMIVPRTVAAVARVTWPVLSLPAQAFTHYPPSVVRDFGRQSFRQRAWTLWSLWSDPALESVVRRRRPSSPRGGTPVLLRHAADDRSVPVASLAAWSALLPDADAATVAAGGHQVLLRSGSRRSRPGSRPCPSPTTASMVT